MAVLLPNCSLTARVRADGEYTRDAHGTPVAPVSTFETRGPWPGSAKEQAAQFGTGGGWSLRLDDRMWPLREGDEVTDGTRTWVVTAATLHQITGPSQTQQANYVSAMATLNPPKPAR